MQNVEAIPVEIFVVQELAKKSATQIIENWPLKSEAIVNVVVKHFHDLGIYRIEPFAHSEVMRGELLHFLRNSPQILEMIDKAKKAAAAASQRGRANQDT